jgi:2TM domain-containing protein
MPVEDDKSIEELRFYARKIVVRRLLFKLNILFYVFTNILLIAINNLTSDPENQWWLWAFTGWTVILLFHTYIYRSKGIGIPTKFHIFSFIVINSYLIFIDLFTDQKMGWSWIPLVSWLLVVLINLVVKHDVTEHKEIIIIYGVLISDNSARVLIDAEVSNEILTNMLDMNSGKIEMIPMFINAIQHFSKEINLKDCNNMQLFGKNLKVISINTGELTITGFIDPRMKDNLARLIFSRIIEKFSEKYNSELEMFKITGNCDPFELYRDTLRTQISQPQTILSW